MTDDSSSMISGSVDSASLPEAENIKKEMRLRSYRAANYVSIAIFVTLTYGSAVIADYLLFELVFWLLRDEIASYSLVATWFNYARVGLALLAIAAAFIHGVVSTLNQVRQDLDMSRRGRGDR